MIQHADKLLLELYTNDVDYLAGVQRSVLITVNEQIAALTKVAEDLATGQGHQQAATACDKAHKAMRELDTEFARLGTVAKRVQTLEYVVSELKPGE